VTAVKEADLAQEARPDRYKWIALSNTTIGVLMATIDSSIVLISLPAIFRGIGLNPLTTSSPSAAGVGRPCAGSPRTRRPRRAGRRALDRSGWTG
jgi:hypothetical protein